MNLSRDCLQLILHGGQKFKPDSQFLQSLHIIFLCDLCITIRRALYFSVPVSCYYPLKFLRADLRMLEVKGKILPTKNIPHSHEKLLLTIINSP